MRHIPFIGIPFLWTILAMPAGATTIDFEGFSDSTILTNQYPTVLFSNAIILTSGISLNELDFPPHSGVNVASDNGGFLSMAFSGPITSFSGYFTYAAPLTLMAFDNANTQVASAASLFSANYASSGTGTPNELISLSFLGGIFKVTIEGDPGGSSFTIDDLSYASKTATTPEPATLPLILGGLAALLALKSRGCRIT